MGDHSLGDAFGMHLVKSYSAYDPETVQLLRMVLDEAWDALQPHYRDQISKSRMAELVLQQAASGERHPSRLRFRAIAEAVQEIAAA
jgi:hypothetical protein